jgi:hypothetical protein
VTISDNLKSIVFAVILLVIAGATLSFAVNGCVSTHRPQVPLVQVPVVQGPVIRANAPEGKISVPLGQPVTIIQTTEPKVTTIPLPNGKTITLAPGQSAKILIKQTGDWVGGVSDLTKTANAQGAGQRTNGEKIDSSIKSTAPTVGFNDFFASGGDTTSDTKAEGSTAVSTLIWVGIGLIVIGLALILWLKIVSLGLAFMIAGGIAIVIGLYPQVLLFAALAGIIVIGLIVYSGWKSKQASTAATVLGAGILAGFTLEPKDLHMEIPVADYANAQKIINATVDAIQLKTQANPKANGFISKLFGK